MNERRVVVTGCGVLSCVGNDVQTFWDSLVNGRCGIGTITRFDTSAYRTHIAGEIKNLDVSPCISVKDARRMDLFTQYAIMATYQALTNAGLTADAGAKRDNGDRLYALAKFMRNAVRTVIHMKNWWMLNIRLQSLSSREEMLAVLDKIEAVAKEEVQNVLDTIPCVETDSRIGWEPSMEYVCDKWHLEWKLRQMESMMLDIIAYRKMIQL